MMINENVKVNGLRRSGGITFFLFQATSSLIGELAFNYRGRH